VAILIRYEVLYFPIFGEADWPQRKRHRELGQRLCLNFRYSQHSGKRITKPNIQYGYIRQMPMPSGRWSDIMASTVTSPAEDAKRKTGML
jgi:hypothetical protein